MSVERPLKSRECEAKICYRYLHLVMLKHDPSFFRTDSPRGGQAPCPGPYSVTVLEPAMGHTRSTIPQQGWLECIIVLATKTDHWRCELRVELFEPTLRLPCLSKLLACIFGEKMKMSSHTGICQLLHKHINTAKKYPDDNTNKWRTCATIAAKSLT